MKWMGILGFVVLLPCGAMAGTCVSQTSAATFPANQPVPMVCDLHGAQKMILVDANGVIAALHGDAVLLAKQIEVERQQLAALWEEHLALEAEIDRMTRLLMSDIGVR